MAANAEIKPIFTIQAVFSGAERVNNTDPKTKEVTVKYRLDFWTEHKTLQNKKSKLVPLNIAFLYSVPNLSIGVKPERYSQLETQLVPEASYILRVCPAAWANSATSNGLWYEIEGLRRIENADLEAMQTFEHLEKQLA